ncbi:MAG: tetratricopeptide repeat protein [Microscillaceae bacterium]|nr:tetratricopeptide repeat protein [Microscillaceae bacterium]
MKHIVLLILLFTLAALSVLPAQEIVQLEERLKTIKEDLNKVPIYLSLARAYRKRKEYQRAVENYFQARNILTKNGREAALANTLDELGALYQEWNGYETSIKYFLGADSLHARNGQLDNRLLSLENAAWSYSQIKKYAEAKEIYEKALPLYRQQNKPEALALALNRLALMHQLNGEPDKALPFVEEELRLYQSNKNENGQVQALNNLAYLHRALKDRRKSFQYFNEAIELNQKKLDKSLSNAEQASLLTNLGVINTNLRNYPAAEDYFQKALRLWVAAQRLDRQADLHNHLALNHYLGGSIEKARPEVELALIQAKASGNKIAERDSYRILADIAEAEGDLKTFRQYSERLNALSKEIDDRENIKRQALINQQLALQQMEGEIALGISRDENQKLELEQQKLIAQRAENDRRVAELTAAQAEKDRQLAYERALRAENDKSLAIAREQKSKADAQAARAEKDLALAQADRNRAQAEKDSLKALEADRNRKLAEAEARQARSEKERLEQEQSQKNARNLLLAIIGFFGLIILFILFFTIKTARKTACLKPKTKKYKSKM